jgi:putative transposase
MPQGLKRYYGTGYLHFITCSCYQRKAWLGTGRRRDLFLRLLEETRQQYRFIILGYVVMPERGGEGVAHPPDSPGGPDSEKCDWDHS